MRRGAFYGRILIACLPAVVITLLVALIWGRPVVESYDHWTTDYRTRFVSHHSSTEHPRVTLVMLDEILMKDQAVRSPISRELLSRIFQGVAAMKPKAIGLEIILERKGKGEDELASTLRKVQDNGVNVVIAVARDIPEANATDDRFAAQNAFIRAAGGPKVGQLYLRTERDGVIRTWAEARPGESELDSFAAVLARVGGAPAHSLERLADSDTSRRIDWLGTTSKGEPPFARIPAAIFLKSTDVPGDKRLNDLVRDRIVIIGVDFDDVDRHHTPLTQGDSDVTGAEIQAQIVAQILDNRFYMLLPMWLALGLTFGASLAGVLIGWSWARAGVLTGVLLLLPYLVLDYFLVSKFGIVIPFIMPVVAWGGGIMTGEALRLLESSLMKLSTLR